MKVSLNWAQDYSNVDLKAIDADELIRKIGAQLGAVEGYWKTGDKYKGVLVAKIVKCELHPNADKLNVCLIDDGGVNQGVKRDEDGLIEVVCGAPNAREGLLVAWLPPGTVVPSTYWGDQLVLEAREIRGVISNGMLASPKELGMSDAHDGILEIDPSEPGAEAAKPGVSFKQLYKLDDLTIEIENKMFTHRPDCFGILGVAREIAGINGQAFTSPDWYLDQESRVKNQEPRQEQILEVKNEIPELCPRYMAAIVSDVKVGPSPMWLQSYLNRVGIRPINNIVDMTNYLMVLTGQPLHAFDFDKIAVNGRATIVVRKPKAGEKMTLLDGKTIEPRADAILICDQDKAIALGGVMGGNNSEIDENTTRIIIECANFDMYNIRKTSMEHGIFSDAVTRFTKGQSPLQCPPVLDRAVQMTTELSPSAKRVSKVDNKHQELRFPHVIHVSNDFINKRLGLNLSIEEMAQLLRNVEFLVSTGEDLGVHPPFWRTDIEIPEDVVEEVGRLYGYDHLPLELPERDLTPPSRNEVLELKNNIRSVLSAAGANELLTYSFVHSNLLSKVGQDKDRAFQIANALSPDLQYYRTGLTASLLDKVHTNAKAGFDEFALFELGKVHYKGEWEEDEPEVPLEDNHLALVISFSDKNHPDGAAYYQAKNYLELLAPETTSMLMPLSSFDMSTDEWGRQLTAPYEPNRSAVIVKDSQIWGVVGEYRSSVSRALKLPAYTAGFEINLGILSGSGQSYRQLSRYPSVTQDISLKISSTISYGELHAFMTQAINEHQPKGVTSRLTALDIYQGEDKSVKHIAFRLEIASYERTLTDPEVNSLLDEVATAANKKFGAERL